MKHNYSIIALIVLLTGAFTEALSQTYNGALSEFFLGRQASARAESMGRGMSAVTGDALSFYYNPAGTASTKGLNLFGSFAQPYYYLEDAKYNFFGASYSIEKYGTAGLSRDYFDYGYENGIIITDEFGNYVRTDNFDPDITGYRLNYSIEAVKDLFVGANLNLLQLNLSDETFTVGQEQGSGSSDVFYLDLGVIRTFSKDKKNFHHKFNLGTSVTNVNFAEYSFVDGDQGDPIPVVFRIGGSYDLAVENKSLSAKLMPYKLLVNIEYEDLLNSAYYGGFHTGLEFTLFEILSLRGGYYTRKNAETVWDTTTNRLKFTEFDVSEFTYGLGLNIPIRQLTKSKTPLELKVDYVNLKQPAISDRKDDWDNFNVLTFTLNWIF